MLAARKWVAVDFGGPEVLRDVEVDVPDPGPGQVTVDVRASGMNPADAKHIAPGQDPALLPLGLGFEGNGKSGELRFCQALWRDPGRIRAWPARPGPGRSP